MEKRIKWALHGKAYILGGNKKRAVFAKPYSEGHMWVFGNKFEYAQSLEDAFNMVEALAERTYKKNLPLFIRPDGSIH